MKMRHKHRMPLGMGLCEPYVHLGARTRKSLGSCAKNTGAGDRLRHAFFVPCTHTSTPERLRRSLYTAHRIVANTVCSLVPNHTATPPPESDDFEPTAAELRAAFPEGGSVRRQATALLATCDPPIEDATHAGVRTAGR